MDVSLVVNIHREGELCVPSLQSAAIAVSHAHNAGLSAELILVLDRPDPLTEQVVATNAVGARIESINAGDLGSARNHGIRSATGNYISFLDGDDLCCRNWLVSAMAEARSAVELHIVHPRFNLFFGRSFSHHFWVLPDMRTDEICTTRLLSENIWTSSLLASADIFRRFSYCPNRINEGFGYEDWVWNLETVMAGFMHVTAPSTIHYIRRNKRDSLMDMSNHRSVLPDFSRFSGAFKATGMLSKDKILEMES
ncbi:glycosyltransferase family 2 protein [Methylobacterium segetis]|uniref:glycosyltransferase family 2 protein n=1 Tax=Methylobacterium segetis TaxID=2488750 RepID=UPI0010521EA6|nr:glycosyltransferase family 2 protein [Methylobacterium segetis]